MSNFLGCFFHVLGVKKFFFSNRIEKLHKVAFIIFFISFLKKFEKVEKTVFYRANTQIWMYYIKVSYCRTGYLDWDIIIIKDFQFKNLKSYRIMLLCNQ